MKAEREKWKKGNGRGESFGLDLSPVLKDFHVSDFSCQFVSAFAVSASASNWERLGKPFNPILGETYELSRLVPVNVRFLLLNFNFVVILNCLETCLYDCFSFLISFCKHL